MVSRPFPELEICDNITARDLEIHLEVGVCHTFPPASVYKIIFIKDELHLTNTNYP